MNLLSKTEDVKLSIEDPNYFINYHRWTDTPRGKECAVSFDNIVLSVANSYIGRELNLDPEKLNRV